MTEDDEQQFTIVDKRHGRESDDAPAEEAAPAADAPPPSAPEPPPTPEPSASAPRGAGSVPALDFSTFIMSLSTSVLFHLGLVAEEEGQPPPPPNLPMARQTIDILEILEQKTRGNLDSEESHLLESLLYELRLRYVELQKRGPA
jgi:hypothetical protein